jgi:hypothetical protein
MGFRRRAVGHKDAGNAFKGLKPVFGIRSRAHYIWKQRLADGCCEKKRPKQARRRKTDLEKPKGGRGKNRTPAFMDWPESSAARRLRSSVVLQKV